MKTVPSLRVHLLTDVPNLESIPAFYNALSVYCMQSKTIVGSTPHRTTSVHLAHCKNILTIPLSSELQPMDMDSRIASTILLPQY